MCPVGVSSLPRLRERCLRYERKRRFIMSTKQTQTLYGEA
jgi:hypothetical protein